LWTPERNEARIFKTRAEVEASFRWLSRLVKPQIETIRVRLIMTPAKGG